MYAGCCKDASENLIMWESVKSAISETFPCSMNFICRAPTLCKGVCWKYWLNARRRWLSPRISPESIIVKDIISVVGFPGGSAGKKSACNAGYPSSIPGLGRYPGEGIGYPHQGFPGGSVSKESACNAKTRVNFQNLSYGSIGYESSRREYNWNAVVLFSVVGVGSGYFHITFFLEHCKDPHGHSPSVK